MRSDKEMAALRAIKRWHATGDYAYPAEECDDGEFVAYDDYRAELLRLARETAELREDRGKQVAARFEERVRAERAERELTALKKRIASAPYARSTRNGVVRTPIGWVDPNAHFALVVLDGDEG